MCERLLYHKTLWPTVKNVSMTSYTGILLILYESQDMSHIITGPSKFHLSHDKVNPLLTSAIATSIASPRALQRHRELFSAPKILIGYFSGTNSNKKQDESPGREACLLYNNKNLETYIRQYIRPGFCKAYTSY